MRHAFFSSVVFLFGCTFSRGANAQAWFFFSGILIEKMVLEGESPGYRAAAAHSPSYHVAKQAASVGENASLGTAKTFCKQNNGSLRTVIYPESITVQAPRYGHRGTKRRGFRGTRTAMVAPTSLAIMIGEYKTM